MLPRPVCTILGGPNGSGKSSIVDALKPVGTFVNADATARRIAPMGPEAASLAAGRLVVRQLDALIRDRASFVYETTLSGLQPIGVMRRAKQAGYEIGIVFVILATVELNIQRVAQGGHDIPETVIRRRYGKTFANLAAGVALADEVVVLDNTGLEIQVLLSIASHTVRENRLCLGEPAHDLIARAVAGALCA